MHRPHIKGWMEPGPECVEGEKCETCGKTGAHDVIVLSRQETLQIIATVRNPYVAMRRQSEVRP